MVDAYLLDRLSKFYKDNPEMKVVPLALDDINLAKKCMPITWAFAQVD